MKKSAIKMIAGVSALAIFSSISATAIPAFAEEYDAIQEQDYVATFADEQTQNVANYLLENGVSMEEAQEMMEHYVNGRAMIEREENAEDGISLLSEDLKRTYYNGNTPATTKKNIKNEFGYDSFKSEQHYGVFVMDKPTANVDVTLKATWGSNSDDTPIFIVDEKKYYIFNGYNNAMSFSKFSAGTGVSFSQETVTKNDGRPLAMCSFPFDLNTPFLKSEAAIKNAISFRAKVDLLEDGNQQNSTFEFHTFVLGDFDHDGVVCDKDYAYLMDFVMNSFDGYLNYKDVGDGTAFEVNTTAVDLNMDGVLDIRDAIAWNKLS